MNENRPIRMISFNAGGGDTRHFKHIVGVGQEEPCQWKTLVPNDADIGKDNYCGEVVVALIILFVLGVIVGLLLAAVL